MLPIPENMHSAFLVRNLSLVEVWRLHFPSDPVYPDILTVEEEKTKEGDDVVIVKAWRRIGILEVRFEVTAMERQLETANVLMDHIISPRLVEALHELRKKVLEQGG